MADQKADTFDADLARVLEIRHTHDLSAPYKDADTCAARDYNQARERCGYLLGFIDKLWIEYSRALQRLDDGAARESSVRSADLAAALAHRACCGTEHDTSQGKLHGYCVVCGVPWPCDTAEHFLRRPAPLSGHGNATTDADRQVGARTAGEVPASDGDSACPAVPAPTGISVVQMIQALRGCVQEMNQSCDHSIALIAQQTLVCLDQLYRELQSTWDEDKPYESWPLIRTQYEIDREREIREFEERNEREPQS